MALKVKVKLPNTLGVKCLKAKKKKKIVTSMNANVFMMVHG